jgi:hypothetical protein
MLRPAPPSASLSLALPLAPPQEDKPLLFETRGGQENGRGGGGGGGGGGSSGSGTAADEEGGGGGGALRAVGGTTSGQECSQRQGDSAQSTVVLRLSAPGAPGTEGGGKGGVGGMEGGANKGEGGGFSADNVSASCSKMQRDLARCLNPKPNP